MSELINKKYKLYEFDQEWFQAFDKPERSGVWIVWGNSGNGKTSFVLQLIKYLASFGKVAYVSLEESSAHTMQNAFIRIGMEEVARRVLLVEREDINDINERLSRKKAPKVVVIDSLQYSDINWATYKKLKEAHGNKLIIFVSHAEGRNPAGRIAKKVMFDATLKIWVEGYRAISKGRYIGPNGGIYTIWDEGAEKYWGEK